MSRLFLFLSFFLLISSAKGQESPAELGVAAIGLVVSDIEQSTYFYTQVLGMVEAGSFSLDTQWSTEAGAANERPFSVKMFRMVDRPTATILKLAYFDTVDRSPDKKGIDASSGVNYLTFNYPSLEAVITRIRNEGIDILGHVKRDTYQLLFIRDPDGIFIELVAPPDDANQK